MQPRRPAAGVATLTDLIRSRAEYCTDRALRRIHADARGSAPPVPLDASDLRHDVARVIEMSLLLAGGDEGPFRRELAWCRDLGARRARQGVPLGEVVRWIHIAQLVVWELLAELAVEAGDGSAQQLLSEAATLWANFDILSSAARKGHDDAAARLSVEARRRALGFLDAVGRYPDNIAVAEELSRESEFDPQGPFLVAVHGGDHRPAVLEIPFVVVEDSSCTTVVTQPHLVGEKAEADLADALDASGVSPIGIGMQRCAIGGARLSLADARYAFAAAAETGAPVVTFREHWLEALAIAHLEEQRDLVEEAVTQIRGDADVRRTLDAYMQVGRNLTAAGRHLGLHPNTVSYRLRQFAARSGLDPRTANGAALTHVARTLADTPFATPDALKEHPGER